MHANRTGRLNKTCGGSLTQCLFCMTLSVFSPFRTVLWKDEINMGVVIGVDPGKREVDESTLKFVVTLHDNVVQRGL